MGAAKESHLVARLAKAGPGCIIVQITRDHFTSFTGKTNEYNSLDNVHGLNNSELLCSSYQITRLISFGFQH